MGLTVIKRLRLPKTRLPWAPAEDADTVWHARSRILLYVLLAAFFVGCWIISFLVRAPLGRIGGWSLGLIGLLGAPLIHHGVRPGKGKIWLISLAILAGVVALVIGFFLFAPESGFVDR